MCIFYTNLAQVYFLGSYIQPCLLKGHQVLSKKANEGLLTQRAQGLQHQVH